MHLTLQYKVSARHSLSSSEFHTALIVNEAFISLLSTHNAGLSNKVSKGTFMTLTGLRLQAAQSTLMALLKQVQVQWNEIWHNSVISETSEINCNKDYDVTLSTFYVWSLMAFRPHLPFLFCPTFAQVQKKVQVTPPFVPAGKFKPSKPQGTLTPTPCPNHNETK